MDALESATPLWATQHALPAAANSRFRGYQAGEGLYRALGKVRHTRLPRWNRMRRVRFTGYADTPALRARNQVAMREPAERCTSFCEICTVYPEKEAVAEAARCLRCRWTIDKSPKAPRTANLRVPKLP